MLDMTVTQSERMDETGEEMMDLAFVPDLAYQKWLNEHHLLNVIRDLKLIHGEDGWAILDQMTPSYLHRFLTLYHRGTTSTDMYSKLVPPPHFLMVNAPAPLPPLISSRNFIMSDALYLSLVKGFQHLNRSVPDNLTFNSYFNLVIQTTDSKYWDLEDLRCIR